MIRPRETLSIPRSGQKPVAEGRERIGAVQYLNTRPLIHGLGNALDFDLPSRLADRLADNELDVAIIPSIELFQRLDSPQSKASRNEDSWLSDSEGRYHVVSNACIACLGPVMSVRLFFRTRPEKTSRIAIDEGSRTSVALSRILLAKRFGIFPKLEMLPIGESIESTNADAVLLIGDRAIGPTSGGFQTVWDLGEEWHQWTGLPFVFAVWAARPSVDFERLGRRLDAARDAGLANLATIAAIEAAPHGLSVPQCLDYLSDNLHYNLGYDEQQGLRRFHEYAMELGLAPSSGNFDAAFQYSKHFQTGAQ
ncbi:MAG TPA: hypothetical protein DEB70_05150 [Planctomycetaceae bacterium]|nr:hypothetical protein [Planctomycetaceae bacterium]